MYIVNAASGSFLKACCSVESEDRPPWDQWVCFDHQRLGVFNLQTLLEILGDQITLRTQLCQ